MTRKTKLYSLETTFIVLSFGFVKVSAIAPAGILCTVSTKMVVPVTLVTFGVPVIPESAERVVTEISKLAPVILTVKDEEVAPAFVAVVVVVEFVSQIVKSKAVAPAFASKNAIISSSCFFPVYK